MHHTTTLRSLLTAMLILAFATISLPAMAATPHIWLTQSEIDSLPMSGSAWTNVKTVADSSLGTPSIGCQSNTHDVRTYAAALVAARTGLTSYKQKARDGIAAVINTEATPQSCGANNGSGLARNLAAYVIAADVMNLAAFDPALDFQFRAWITSMLNWNDGSGWTLQKYADKRPSNKGTFAAASVVAVAAYTNNPTLLAKMATELRGWLGDRTAYTAFSVPSDGTVTWFVDSSTPRYVSPRGVLSSIGRDITGAVPAEMIRGGAPAWCPGKTDYPYAALSGTYLEAEILYRSGYPDVYTWQNNAIYNTMDFLHRLSVECASTWSFPTNRAYKWMPYLINFAYTAGFPKPAINSAELGFNMAFTNWTHDRQR